MLYIRNSDSDSFRKIYRRVRCYNYIVEQQKSTKTNTNFTINQIHRMNYDAEYQQEHPISKP